MASGVSVLDGRGQRPVGRTHETGSGHSPSSPASTGPRPRPPRGSTASPARGAGTQGRASVSMGGRAADGPEQPARRGIAAHLERAPQLGPVRLDDGGLLLAFAALLLRRRRPRVLLELFERGPQVGGRQRRQGGGRREARRRWQEARRRREADGREPDEEQGGGGERKHERPPGAAEVPGVVHGGAAGRGRERERWRWQAAAGGRALGRCSFAARRDVSRVSMAGVDASAAPTLLLLLPASPPSTARADCCSARALVPLGWVHGRSSSPVAPGQRRSAFYKNRESAALHSSSPSARCARGAASTGRPTGAGWPRPPSARPRARPTRSSCRRGRRRPSRRSAGGRRCRGRASGGPWPRAHRNRPL